MNNSPRFVIGRYVLIGMTASLCCGMLAAPRAHAAKKPSFRGKYTGTYKSDDGTKTGTLVLNITGDRTIHGQRVLTGKGTFDGVTQYMVGTYLQPTLGVDGFSLALINKNGRGRIVNVYGSFEPGAKTTQDGRFIWSVDHVAVSTGDITVTRP